MTNLLGMWTAKTDRGNVIPYYWQRMCHF
jgi:hypothetical protein